MTPDPSKIHRRLLERDDVRACRAIKTNAGMREYIHQELLPLHRVDLIIIFCKAILSYLTMKDQVG